MKIRVTTALFVACFTTPSLAQQAITPAGDAVGAVPVAAAQTPAASSVWILPANTEITITPNSELSSKNLKAGDTFSFSTVYDVLMNNYIVVPKGTRGQGKVTWRTGKGAFGKSAKMDLAFDWIDVGGRRVTIEGKHRQEGSGNTAATVGTAVAVGPFAAFVTGKSATVPNGMHLKAFTAEPIQFQVAGLLAAPQAAQVVPVANTTPAVTQGTSPAVSAVSSGDSSQ